MTEVPEADAITYIMQLAALEKEGARTAFMIGPFTTFTLIGALQLATRHPEMSQSQRDVIDQVKEKLMVPFLGTLAEQIIKLGDDPANDVDRRL